MKPVVVGISDCRVSSDADAMLVTYALGSCIAVMLHDPERRVAGMLHYMLPDSALDPKKAAANPFMFADTGIQALWEQVRASGVNPKKITVRLAGGAQVLDRENIFGIGRRNYLAARKVLWKLGLFVASEAVGGESSRTVRLEVASGRSWLREGNQTENEFTVSSPGVATGGLGALARSVGAPANRPPTVPKWPPVFDGTGAVAGPKRAAPSGDAATLKGATRWRCEY